MRIQVDKIASVTRQIPLDRALTLSPDMEVVPGSVIAARVLNDKNAYNTLEDVFGRLNRVNSGDLIVGALGHRKALHGYEGVMPEKVAVGDRLQLLNLGGVIGHCLSHNPEVGPPFELEVLGQVMVYPEFGSRRGVAARVQDHAVASGTSLPRCPVVFVAGTCMNSGKTAAATRLIKGLRQSGLRVAGCKLTGISALRDILEMRDYGAEWVSDFTDAGATGTTPANAAALSHRIFAALGRHSPDVIVAETGDGVMGEYGVQAILEDPELQSLCAAFVFCANDPVGVAGGVHYLKARFGLAVDVITGPATDNAVGLRFIRDEVGVAAHNARRDAPGLIERVKSLIARHQPGQRRVA
ncbi:hypothetical protein [Natronospira bacteriovora]|uniref:DUF1611 domain-containing protein n=1 Tax=Natronospira bacteriovora TaxID=3069753 RepID=A0ABU0W6F5_9GAMM|nr:hypothetical protein [Natronospira sp. AB-CW4]MDQ2069586.1 hypothetical protein [Natronospira sp. AB-CW4]